MEKGKLDEPNVLNQLHLFYNDGEKAANGKKQYSELIKESSTILTFKLPIIRDNGKIDTLQAFRVHHSYHSLPCKGGLRFSQDLTAESIEAQAFHTTIKMGLCDIPFGGSCGGVKCNPNDYSPAELERITRRYTMELSRKGFIGPAIDVPEPDIGTDATTMAYMKDTYQLLYGNKDINAAAVCTGKPASQGGIEGWDEAFGLSICHGIQEFLSIEPFCKKYNLTLGLTGKTIILQGLGKLGGVSGKFLAGAGAKIIGVLVSSSAVYNPEGLDYDDVVAYYKANKSLIGYKKAKECLEGPAAEEIFYKPCDILVPAAFENTININNVDKLQAKIIAEAANAPTTYFAQKMLDYKGIAVLPDFILNTGGNVVSYLEWLKNINHVKLGRLIKGWEKQTKMGILSLLGKDAVAQEKAEGPSERDIVYTAINEMVHSVVKEVYALSESKKISLRIAGYAIAIERIHKMYEEAGFVI